MASVSQSRTASRAAISLPSVLGVFLLLAGASYGALIWAPTERTMGLIQRIFYFHVSSAWAGMDILIVCFLANLLYVWKRESRYDALGVACAEVGLVFMTVVLITGPI